MMTYTSDYASPSDRGGGFGSRVRLDMGGHWSLDGGTGTGRSLRGRVAGRQHHVRCHWMRLLLRGKFIVSHLLVQKKKKWVGGAEYSYDPHDDVLVNSDIHNAYIL